MIRGCGVWPHVVFPRDQLDLKLLFQKFRVCYTEWKNVGLSEGSLGLCKFR